MTDSNCTSCRPGAKCLSCYYLDMRARQEVSDFAGVERLRKQADEAFWAIRKHFEGVELPESSQEGL